MTNKKELMLSTFDNPFNPFTQFDEWYAFDSHKGYYCLERVARVLRTSDELSEADQVVAYNTAVMETVRVNETGMYKKVVNPLAS